MSKFYAVKVGKVPGIYTNWPECQKNVTGFSGACYKSFSKRADAEAFIKVESHPVLGENVIEIFTDGSHKKHEKNGHLGVGIFCKYRKEEFEYSMPVTKDILEKEGIDRDAPVSNPFCELLAYREVLRLMFLSGKDLSKYTFLVKMDYEGVEKWMNGSWKCKELYIKTIKKSCDDYLSKLKCKIILQHVSAHSNDYCNDRADELAKSEVFKNTFSQLFEKL
jgi:ribonuclease HI